MMLPEGDMDATAATDLCDRAAECGQIADQLDDVWKILSDCHADGSPEQPVIRAALADLRAARKSLDALVAGLEGGW